MFKPAPKPKRIGGAPFARSLPHHRPSGAQTARAAPSPKDDPQDGVGQQQFRHSDAGAAQGSFPSGSVRCRSEDDRRATATPCTERAQQYVKKLVGGNSDGGKSLDWTLIQEMDAMDYYWSENHKRDQVREKRHQHVSTLLEQREAKAAGDRQRLLIWNQWREEAEVDVKNFQQEEKDKKNKKVERQRQYHQECKSQLEAAKERVRQVREVELAEEAAMTQKVKDAITREAALDIEKKRNQRKVAQEMQLNAKHALLKKEEARSLEKRMDTELAIKQREMLEKQEKDKAAREQDRQDKLTKLQQAYEAGVGSEMERRAKEDDDRARRQREALESKERHLQDQKNFRKQQMRDAGKAAINQQMQDQEAARAQRRADDDQYAADQRRKAQEAEVKEMSKQSQRKQAVEAHAEYLRRQIQERHSRTPDRVGRDQMDEVEKALNRDKLLRAKDPNRHDGLQLLLKKKRLEYRDANHV